MIDAIGFRHPAGRPTGETVYAPVCHMGLGTGDAAVMDERRGRAVYFRSVSLTIIGVVVCAECLSLEYDADAGLHLVELPGGSRAWVRDVRESERGNGEKGRADDTAA
jgi:hypothetical protein